MINLEKFSKKYLTSGLRCRKSPSTGFHPKQVNFCLLMVLHIGSALSNYPIYHEDQQFTINHILLGKKKLRHAFRK